jgi:type IV pilus assembly protein PilE
MNRCKGFTLIEMMIVVAILAILVGIAYPSYTRYVIETRRADGQIGLTQTAARLEKFYTHCNRYTESLTGAWPGTCIPAMPAGAGLGLPNDTSPDRNYRLTITALPVAEGGTGDIRTSYRITAIPQGAQTADTDCGNLRLNSLGRKDQTGPNTQGRCWRR